MNCLKRILPLLCCLLLLCPLLSGCKSKKPLNISYILETEPANLDPQTAAEQSALIVINNIYEGLFTISSDGMVKNAIALSHTVSGDGLTYTIQLDPAAKWRYARRDGSVEEIPVTAHDFVFAFRRLLRPDTRSDAASRFFCIRSAEEFNLGECSEALLGVYADADNLLRFELLRPDANFLSLLASSYALPCNEAFFTETMGKYGLGASTVMANGPFYISSWTQGETIKLSKNDRYRAAEEVSPSAVNLRIASSFTDQGSDDASSAVTAADAALSYLQKGYADAAFIDGSNISALRSKDYALSPVENSVWGLVLNLDNPTLANVNMRKAIARAFDREAYRTLLSENLSVASALIPHGVSVFGKNYRGLAGDIMTQEFEAQLAFQHYKEGLGALGQDGYGELTLLLNRDAGVDCAGYFSLVSQRLQKEISLFFKTESLSDAEYQKRLASGNFDAALIQLKAADGSPRSVLEQFADGNSKNYYGYANPGFDAAISAAFSAETPEAAVAAYTAAETLLLDDAVFIPMLYSTDYFVTAPGIAGIEYNSQTGLIRFASAHQAE